MSFDRVYSKKGMLHLTPENDGSTVGGLALGMVAGIAPGANGGALFNQPVPATGTATVLAGSGTITHNGAGVVRIAPASAVTGIIVQAGSFPGQRLVIINNSGSTFTATMAASGTSNVANGASCAVSVLAAIELVWDSVQALWYQIRAA